MFFDYRQQPPMGMQQMPMGTLQQPMEFQPQFGGQQGAAPQQFFPGIPGFPGTGTERRLNQLERQVERLNRQVERLDRRVSRIERQLGYSRPDYYDLPNHSEFYG